MAHINLLPWRAERRKQRQREFIGQLILSLVAALVFVLLWAIWMNLRIDNQNERNAYLQGEIKQLDDRIAKIKDLEKVRERLLARKQIIEQLQANRSQMVHLFDELVRTIPSSARLAALKQNGDSMSLDGVAQSNASVAEYMRNIEGSPWMGHTDLRKTENSHDSSRMPYAFGLDVALSRPKSDEDGGGAANGQANGQAASGQAAGASAPAAAGAPASSATSAGRQALTDAAKAVVTVSANKPAAPAGKPAPATPAKSATAAGATGAKP